MDLGAIIRRRREDMGLTQEQVSRRTQISKPYLSNIETGRAKNPPADRVLHKIERTLNFHPGELTRMAHLARTPVDVRGQLELREAQVRELRGMVAGLLSDTGRTPSGDVDHRALLADAGEDNAIVLESLGALVPVINSVAAGYPHEFTDLDYPPSVADEYIRCPGVTDRQAFAARVVGDSMDPAYQEGDIVVFAPNTPPANGDDCFVRFDGDGGTTFKRYYQDDEHTVRLQPINSAYPAQTYPVNRITGLWPAIYRVQRLREP